MKNQSRREFFKKAAGLAGAVVVAPTVLNSLFASTAQAAAGCDTMPLAEPGKDMAASVNYVAKVADVKDAKAKVERQGVAWGKQTCSNCGLYNKKCGAGADEKGTCAIFAGKVVMSTGWCTSWNKKA